MNRIIALIVLVIGLTPARAQEPTNDTITYRVKAKDSLELIAAEFYGDRNKAIFIMVANKIVHPRPLKAGERLRIPVSRQVITAPGDSFDSLAQTYLGDKRRGTFLAEFNGIPHDTAALPSGTSVAIPFTVTHTASANESIASIAAAYFGDTKNASMIRRYNFVEKDTIDKGEQLVVPIFNVRLSQSKMPAVGAEANARRDRQRAAQARAAKAIPAALQAWREGDLGAAKAALSEVELDFDYLETAQVVEVGVLVGAIHVASDDTRPALESFKRVLERKPRHMLDPYHYSPKILQVWKEAGGAVTEG